MGRDERDIPASLCSAAGRTLQRTLVAFFAVALAALLVIYLAAPDVYVLMLFGSAYRGDAHPPSVTVCLGGIVALVSLLVVGVLRRWRWVFWVLLIAFTASILQVPVAALELTGLIQTSTPSWYIPVRALVACLQFLIGAAMVRLYRRCGVWGMGCKRVSSAV